MKNKTNASNGTNDKANEAPTSAATAQIANTNQESNEELLMSYYRMLKETAPELEMIKQSLNHLSKEETKQLHEAYNDDYNGAVLFYDDLQEWESQRDDNGDLTDGITPNDIANYERILAERRPILESLLCQKAQLIGWADLDWLLRNNAHVRKEVSSMIEERYEKQDKIFAA